MPRTVNEARELSQLRRISQFPDRTRVTLASEPKLPRLLAVH